MTVSRKVKSEAEEYFMWCNCTFKNPWSENFYDQFKEFYRVVYQKAPAPTRMDKVVMYLMGDFHWDICLELCDLGKSAARIGERFAPHAKHFARLRDEQRKRG